MKKMLLSCTAHFACIVMCVMLLAGCFLSGCTISAKKRAEMRIGLVIEGKSGDGGIYDAARNGLKGIETRYGVKTAEYECCNDTEAYAEQIKTAAEESDVVFVVGNNASLTALDAASNYGSVKFICYIDNIPERSIPQNVHLIAFCCDKAMFIGGYIAASMTQTGIIGGLTEQSFSDELMTYFNAGAVYVRENIESVSFKYENTDGRKRIKEKAYDVFDSGADVVLTTVSNDNSLRAAARETRNFLIEIDYMKNVYSSDELLCRIVFDIEQSIIDTAALLFTSSDWEGGLSSKLDMSTEYLIIDYTAAVSKFYISDELRQEIDKVILDVNDGSIKIEPQGEA